MFRHVFLDLFRRSGLNPKHGPRKIALRALEGELALPQNRNPVAQGLNLGRIVAAEKQRDLLPCGKVPKKLPDLAFPRNVEFLSWFVEEQDLRVAREDPAEFQPLPHSGGEPSDRPVCVCGEVQTTEPFLQFRFATPAGPALKRWEEGKALLRSPEGRAKFRPLA